MEEKVLLMLLEHFKECLFQEICQILHLDYYVEDNTITISGINFVIDIFKEEKQKHVMLTFIDDSYKPYFSYVECYLNICLKNHDMKMFFYLLKYFSQLDKIGKNKIEITKQKITRNKYFSICNCLYNDPCFVASFEDIIKKGTSYNIFTHRNEKMIFLDKMIFNYELKNNKILFYEEFIDFIDDESFKNNYKFYKLIEDKYKYKEDKIFGNENNVDFVVTTDLSFYIEKNMSLTRNPALSFLLKRGYTIKESLEYIE